MTDPRPNCLHDGDACGAARPDQPCTATPFRADQQQLHGEVLYRFSFANAMVHGYIKKIHSRNVAPAELYFTYANDTKRHTLEEVTRA